MIATVPADRLSDRATRGAAWCLLALLASLLGACAASSSTDQIPVGPKPAVTVLLRLRSPDGPQVQLLATGVDLQPESFVLTLPKDAKIQPIR